MIRDAQPDEIEIVREMFREYQDFLGFELCFQSFEEELANLPGAYGPPRGELLVALKGDEIVGCIALRPLADNVCEMKRLYLRPGGRSLGLGRALCVELIERARRSGFNSMKLDTVSKLKKAIALYEEFGFKPCDRYCENPQPDVLYMELKL